jgi:hypothetical protein
VIKFTFSCFWGCSNQRSPKNLACRCLIYVDLFKITIIALLTSTGIVVVEWYLLIDCAVRWIEVQVTVGITVRNVELCNEWLCDDSPVIWSVGDCWDYSLKRRIVQWMTVWRQSGDLKRRWLLGFTVWSVELYNEWLCDDSPVIWSVGDCWDLQSEASNCTMNDCVTTVRWFEA